MIAFYSTPSLPLSLLSGWRKCVHLKESSAYTIYTLSLQDAPCQPSSHPTITTNNHHANISITGSSAYTPCHFNILYMHLANLHLIQPSQSSQPSQPTTTMSTSQSQDPVHHWRSLQTPATAWFLGSAKQRHRRFMKTSL